MSLSFDMSWNLDISGLPNFLLQFSNHSQYYTTDDGRPWASTYDGGTTSNANWNSSFLQPLQAKGTVVIRLGDCMATAGTTVLNVSDSADSFLIQDAYETGKDYMMRKPSQHQIVYPTICAMLGN
ncbi:hypothetical protein BGW36DRAFT_355375 [Talaromyces proteolyticus]|uniref:Uncharacterized protein n=1 Tax=Talaromyces proteolyticus TaxID=1131652 RepID=A0AAD4L5L4_9EURO|nr:uncharacterized protein BGW36DRAFT_355375 [Talaromyces proteolyticus]KAH8703992.1 hypothetical protein BGW36DRAFT_355375 [Talaromyces proteolyticus]